MNQKNFNESGYKKGKIPFKPAEIKKRAVGYVIEFYFTHPETGKLTRHRISKQKEVAGIKDQRLALMKLERQCRKIDKELSEGWTPAGNLIKDEPNEDSLVYHLDKYIANKEKEVRGDTIRVYKSQVKRIKEWLASIRKENVSIYEVDYKMILSFKDYLNFKLDISNTTFNNNVRMCKVMWNWFINEMEVDVKNPFTKLKRKESDSEPAAPIPKGMDEEVLNYCRQYDPAMELLINLINGPSFMRPKEVLRCTVGCVNFRDKIINLRASMSKTKKDRIVHLHDHVVDLMLKNGMDKLPKTAYLIGKECVRYAPLTFGTNKQIDTRDVNKNWCKLRNTLNLPMKYKLYSFKYRGVGELVLKGHNLKEISMLTGHLTNVIERYLPEDARNEAVRRIAMDSDAVGFSSDTNDE